MPKHISLNATVSNDLAGLRLDQALAKIFPDYSRSRLQAWIRAGQVFVDHKVLKAKDKVNAQQLIEIQAALIAETTSLPQNIPLTILYEDDALIVIDKPAGLVVHPGAGNPHNTLLNALLHHSPTSVTLPRSGIIHRLDKETSGLLVIARTLKAHTSLVAQLQDRTIQRHYLAIANGILISGGTIETCMGRNPTQRTKMAVLDYGKPAITHYRILERFRAHTALDVALETGRTHQIRVHMAHIHHPLVGDKTYGGRPKLPPHASEPCKKLLQSFPRQALHAHTLTFLHPDTQEEMTFTAPMPEDLALLMAGLREDKVNNECTV